MSKIIIIGAGGHARETLGIFLDRIERGDHLEILGFIDEDQSNHGKILDGFPVLGDFNWFKDTGQLEVNVICAVGTPQVSRRLVLKARSLGLNFIEAISPRAYISPYARIGKGVIIFPNVIVNSGAIIGDFTTLNVAVTISHDSIVGNFCNINPGAHLAGNVTLGEGCYIGMGANIIQGPSIGSWSINGAGAVVIENIPANVTAVGVPARVIKIREKGWHER
jgi:sugar O-acyltransferase (sialic acid O-acetyltransferase NeuD family)